MIRVEFSCVPRTKILEIERIKTILFFSSFNLVESESECKNSSQIFINTATDFIELYINAPSVPDKILNVLKDNGGGKINFI